MLEISIARCSECGLRPANEDALCEGGTAVTRHAVLCDGAGGHARGAEAAQWVVAHVDRSLAAAPFGPEALTQALLAAHLALQDGQAGLHGRRRMHATVVVLWIETRTERALWSHVGDSRLYRFRYGAVERLTSDDSVVQRLLEAGALTPVQARDHPLKNQLLAAVGMQEPVEPHTAAAPVALEDGDAFLLCSDGWWNSIEEAEMGAALRDAATPADWLDAMRAAIVARALPGQDNFSAVAVWAADPDESTQSMDEASADAPDPAAAAAAAQSAVPAPAPAPAPP